MKDKSTETCADNQSDSSTFEKDAKNAKDAKTTLDGPLKSSRYSSTKKQSNQNEKQNSITCDDSDLVSSNEVKHPNPNLDHQNRTVSLPKADKVSSKDENLPKSIQPDPRGSSPSRRITTKANHRGKGRNTESFDPASTLVRPDLRIRIGSNSISSYNQKLKHDDVLIVPELFGKEDDWSMYYKLIEEMTDIQNQPDFNSGRNFRNGKSTDWISWHEGAHLILKDPSSSPTFQSIIDKLCTYFHIRPKSIGTRFNWYRDSNDWKPFHHDSAAFNPQRAKNQNITVGVSFGATRELAFVRAYEHDLPEPLLEQQQKHHQNRQKVRIYFPQTNNGVFSFGRDANILWKHGVNALSPEEQTMESRGRISIILWGLAQNVEEESFSPPLLGSNGQGPHASRNQNRPGRGPPRRMRGGRRRSDFVEHRSNRGRDNFENRDHGRQHREKRFENRGRQCHEERRYDDRSRSRHGRNESR